MGQIRDKPIISYLFLLFHRESVLLIGMSDNSLYEFWGNTPSFNSEFAIFVIGVIMILIHTNNKADQGSRLSEIDIHGGNFMIFNRELSDFLELGKLCCDRLTEFVHCHCHLGWLENYWGFY